MSAGGTSEMAKTLVVKVNYGKLASNWGLAPDSPQEDDQLPPFLEGQASPSLRSSFPWDIQHRPKSPGGLAKPSRWNGWKHGWMGLRDSCQNLGKMAKPSESLPKSIVLSSLRCKWQNF